MKFFLDANVLFSASNTASNLAALIRLLTERAEVVTSDLAAEEARRNVHLKRPAWADGLATLIGTVAVVPSITFPLPVPLDPKDVPILCTAIRQKCDYLVTGDKKDFGHLYDRAVDGLTVITPLRLTDILAGINP